MLRYIPGKTRVKTEFFKNITFGDIVLANDIQVGANAVVTKSCTKDGAILVGVPAKDVSAGEEA